MRTPRDAYEALRRPEYTGENRCLPCTAVNAGIALVVAAVVASLVGPAVGGAVLAVCALVLALRGYLVPGTPALTRRYLPDRVLARFDHAADGTGADDPDADVDVAAELLTAGAVTECEADDLCLAPAFGDELRSRAEALDDDEARRAAVRRYGDVAADADVSFEPLGPSFTVRVDGRPWGEYPSETAFVAEAAGADLLAESHPRWDALSLEQRGELLAGLRLFLDRCPTCGGTATVAENAVDSCCRDVTVVAVTCDDCGARLFEVERSGAATV